MEEPINTPGHRILFSPNNAWKTSLFVVTFALLIYVTISGTITFLWPSTHYFIQFNVLFHTGVGIIMALLMSYFYIRHWLLYRTKKITSGSPTAYRWIGHIAGVSLIFSAFTGALLIFTGVSGRASFYYWLHIIVSLAGFTALGYHLIFSFAKRKPKEKKSNPLPIRKGFPISISWGVIILAICALFGFTYMPSIGNTVEHPQYSYPYGSNPFAPSQTTTLDSAFINEEVMVDSRSCGESACHTEIYEQWSESAHRYSTDNPWFERALAEMVATEGNNATRYCGGCHDPIALLSGKMDTLGSVRNSHENEGISCIVCHSITKINDLTGTSAYTLSPLERYLFWDKEGTVPEYVNNLLIRLKPGPHSDTFMKPFYKDPEYCSLCHKQYIDERTSGYRWLRLQNQYDNWQQSGYSQESVMVWYPQEERQTCNDCHMQGIASYDPAANDGQVLSHRYIAANTGIPFFYGYQTQLAETIKWLEREEIKVDIFAMALEDRSSNVAPLNQFNPSLASGQSYIFDVSVTNNIAHLFPTGPLDLYEAWLEFKVIDGNGVEIFSSGFVNEAGFLDEDAHQFIAPPITGEGDWIRKHDLWNEHNVAFKNAIPAQQTDIVHYKVSIPETAVPPYTLTSRVRYRRFNRWYTEWALGQDAPSFPIVDLSSDTITLGGDAPGGEPAPDDYMRFNQYGVGLFRQGLYIEAEEAFARAAELNPEYADAYINAGLVNLQIDLLAQAKDWILQALNADPSSLRAQAYLGIVRQRQGVLWEAITLLTKVLEEYPRDRKVLFELGKTYYLSDQDEEAIQIFQQSLAIDPDQATVFSSLELCYAALGQDAKAQVARNEFLRLERLPVIEARAVFFEENEWAQQEAFLYHTH